MKNPNLLKALFIPFIMILCSSSPLFALTATEIVEKSEQIIQGNTQISVCEITIKTRRWTRTMKMKSYGVRKEKKSFSEIYEPIKDAGNRFLLLDDLMWHYVPKLQQVIKISPSMMLQSWMGSDFSNDDIVKESSIIEDYTHTLLGNETIDKLECYKIELIPKPDAPVVWGKIVYYARTPDYLPVRKEYYNEHNDLKKFMTFSQFRQLDDRVVPTLYKMETVGKQDQYTLMEITAAKYDAPMPENIFTLQNLKRK